MKLEPYIHFNGQCQSAMNFYQQHLGAKILFSMTNAEAPGAHTPAPGTEGQILHASMDIGGHILMACDAPAGHFDQPQGFSLSLSSPDLAEVNRVFTALSQNGTVKMPLQKTFWTECFGMLVDQFGIPWMVSAEYAQEHAQAEPSAA